MFTAFTEYCFIRALDYRPLTRVEAPQFQKVIRHSPGYYDTWDNVYKYTFGVLLMKNECYCDFSLLFIVMWLLNNIPV